MATAKAINAQLKKIGQVKLDLFEFKMKLDEKQQKAFLKNPKLFFRKFAKQTFGKCNGVSIDSDWLSSAVSRAKQHPGPILPLRGVKCHIPQGPKACKIIVIKQPGDWVPLRSVLQYLGGGRNKTG